jgi:hypothetical protein
MMFGLPRRLLAAYVFLLVFPTLVMLLCLWRGGRI